MAMEGDVGKIVAELSSNAVLRDSDVLFAQEVVRPNGGPSVAERVAVKLGRHVVFASPDGNSTVGGLAILSRYPLSEMKVQRLKAQNLILRSRKRIALGATIETPEGPIRIINTHLDTRINPGQRVDQLEPAIDDAKSFPGPAVIGGDFNTNDMQWVSNIVPVPFPGWQASRVRILMRTHGFSTPFVTRRATFDHLGMQLDWIFTTGLTAVGSGIQPMEFSDHHAIWAQLNPVQPGSQSSRSKTPAAP
jgi:endonuclease/exonuclease/phosphatase family metal-dependent hydrolase